MALAPERDTHGSAALQTLGSTMETATVTWAAGENVPESLKGLAGGSGAWRLAGGVCLGLFKLPATWDLLSPHLLLAKEPPVGRDGSRPPPTPDTPASPRAVRNTESLLSK